MLAFRTLAGALLLSAFTLGVAACTTSAPTLSDRSFLSVGVSEAGAAKLLVAGTRIRLDFGPGKLSVTAGCNSIGGTYRVEQGRLVFAEGAMTAMGCDAARDAQDQWLMQLLSAGPTVRLVGNELTLESDRAVVRLMDRKVADPDVALAGHPWTVVSIIAAETVSSVQGGPAATLTFNADGTLSVATGCNDGNATWKKAGSGVEISGLVLTKRACAAASGGQLEDAIVKVLRAGSVGATIDSDQLTLQAAGGGLQLRAS
jgi:heat shock protein HslJ